MAHDEVLERIASIDLFSSLPRRQQKKVADAGRMTTIPAGKAVTEEGRDALAFHLVVAGKLDVTINGSVVRELGPGDYFGEISLIDGKPRSATVTATEDTQCFALPHLGFQRLLEQEPEVAYSLLVVFATRLREAESRSA